MSKNYEAITTQALATLSTLKITSGMTNTGFISYDIKKIYNDYVINPNDNFLVVENSLQITYDMTDELTDNRVIIVGNPEKHTVSFNGVDYDTSGIIYGKDGVASFVPLAGEASNSPFMVDGNNFIVNKEPLTTALKIQQNTATPNMQHTDKDTITITAGASSSVSDATGIMLGSNLHMSGSDNTLIGGGSSISSNDSSIAIGNSIGFTSGAPGENSLNNIGIGSALQSNDSGNILLGEKLIGEAGAHSNVVIHKTVKGSEDTVHYDGVGNAYFLTGNNTIGNNRYSLLNVSLSSVTGANKSIIAGNNLTLPNEIGQSIVVGDNCSNSGTIVDSITVGENNTRVEGFGAVHVGKDIVESCGGSSIIVGESGYLDSWGGCIVSQAPGLQAGYVVGYTDGIVGGNIGTFSGLGQSGETVLNIKDNHKIGGKVIVNVWDTTGDKQGTLEYFLVARKDSGTVKASLHLVNSFTGDVNFLDNISVAIVISGGGIQFELTSGTENVVASMNILINFR